MQQRQPRLGDILDDYCTRERRITNHAIVAMVGEEIRLTRCTTCDAEHPYKHAKVPATRRRKDAVSQAYQEVLAAVQQDAAPGTAIAALRSPNGVPADEAGPAEAPAGEVVEAAAEAPEVERASSAPPDEAPASAEAEGDRAASPEEGPVHRRLIRAQLPRLDPTQAQRPLPEFTMHTKAAPFRGRGAHAAGGHAGAGRGHGRGGGHRAAGFDRGGGRSGGFVHRAPGRPAGTEHGGRHHRGGRGRAPGPGKKHSK
jgi:hypothetical protein